MGETAVTNKWILEEEKPANVWNAKKCKWTKPNTQIGYKAMTCHEMFSEMQEEKNDAPDLEVV